MTAPVGSPHAAALARWDAAVRAYRAALDPGIAGRSVSALVKAFHRYRAACLDWRWVAERWAAIADPATPAQTGAGK